MHILLTGGTGLIGSALCHYWQAAGHQLSVLSRYPPEVSRRCGPRVRGIACLDELDDGPLDVVINLAGAPIAERTWSPSRKALLRDSRVALTHHLVDWLASRSQRPAVLLSGSATGFYGDTGELAVTEVQPAGTDFGSRLCADWEEAARRAVSLGIRVVLLRTGLVIAARGGFLSKLLPAYRFGLGGRLGAGRQWMPWIHLQDELAAIEFLLHQPEASGAYNLTAPAPVRNTEFTRALGKCLHRPACCPVPSPLLRLGLGERALLLLGGQQALPARLEAAGFRFRYPVLDEALAVVLAGQNR